jgi:putative flippase GtrA
MTNTQWRFGRFAAVGLIGTGLQLLLLSLLTRNFGFSIVTATPIAVEIALLHNFIWHERFTWRDRGLKPVRPRQTLSRLLRFQTGNGLISLGGNTVLTCFLVEQLKFTAMPAAIAAIIACSALNFIVADRWVYV